MLQTVAVPAALAPSWTVSHIHIWTHSWIGSNFSFMSDRFDLIVPISELQTRSRRLVEQVKKTGKPIVVTQRGRPAAMLVNYDLYEGHIATMEETSSPGWEKRLERAQREIAAGHLVPHGEVLRRRRRRRR